MTPLTPDSPLDRGMMVRLIRTIANDLDESRQYLAEALSKDSAARVIVAAEVVRARLTMQALALRDTIETLENGGITDEFSRPPRS